MITMGMETGVSFTSATGLKEYSLKQYSWLHRNNSVEWNNITFSVHLFYLLLFKNIELLMILPF